MKRVIIPTIIIIILVLLLIINTIKNNMNKYLILDGEFFQDEYQINDNISLSGYSRYSVSLKSNGKYNIPSFIYKIGWNEKYIVALQYDLAFRNDYNSYLVPDQSAEHYYIIDLEHEEQIGPLSSEEYFSYECSNIEMKITHSIAKKDYYHSK